MFNSNKFTLIAPVGGEENPIDVDEEEEEEQFYDDTLLYADDSNDDNDKDFSITNLFADYPLDKHPEGDLAGETKLIKLTKNDIRRLLYLIFPSSENIKYVLSNLFHSSIKSREEIGDVALKWAKHNPDDSTEIFENIYAHYEVVNNNNWIFNLIYMLNPWQRRVILEQYFNNDVDITCKINIFDNSISFDKLELNEYKKSTGSGVRVGEFLMDLKKSVALISFPRICIVKLPSNDTLHRYKLTIMKENELTQILKTIKLGTYIDGKKTIVITGLSVYNYNNNSNFIKYKAMKFFSTEPGVFSFFQGYQIKEVEEISMWFIEPFIMHVFKIICSSKKNIYIYLMKWIAYILQNPSGKTKTAIVITGAQGAGKNTFTDQICRLFGDYANNNTKSENILGTFNGVLFNKKLLVCNEMPSIDSTKKNVNFDLLKTLITEDSIDINLKHQDPIHVENVSNFIFLSNHFAPVKIEVGDRRFVVIRVSSNVRCDANYFTPLYASFTHEFYENLFTFFSRMDITGFDPTNIPESAEKEAIQELSKTIYEIFIQDHINDYLQGFEKQKAYQTFQEWCEKNGNPKGKKAEFLAAMLKYCVIKRPWNGGTNRKFFYHLQEDARHLFNIPE